MFDVKNLILSLPAIYLAIVPHEIAHGYMALKMGDSTAKDMGRISFNPAKHFDILGFISMIIFKFGWAKPVPINPNNFRDYKKGLRSVALAGPITNLIIAVIASLLLKLFHFLQIKNDWSGAVVNGIGMILFYIIIYSVVLGVFNLLPLPPLDGSNVLRSFLSWDTDSFFRNNERVLSFITMILVISGITGKVIFPLSVKIINRLVG